MRRLFAIVVDLISLDEFGRRAVAETLADWQHEEAQSSSPSSRVWIHMRGTLAVVGVLTRVAVHELRVSDTWLAIGGILGLGLLFSLVQVALMLSRLAVNDDGAWDAWRFVFLMPQSLAVGIALAAMTPHLARVRRVPVLSTSLAVMLLMVASVGWVIPDSNQAFRRQVAASYGRPEPARGLAEQPVSVVVELAQYEGRAGQQARQGLARLAWLVVLPPALLLLGAQARRLTRSRRWRFGAGALAWSVLVGALALGATVTELVRWLAFSDATGALAWTTEVRLWIALWLVGVATVFLARMSTRREQQHAVG